MTRLPQEHLERAVEASEEVVEEASAEGSSQMSDSQLLMGLVSDPEVQAVLAARRSGQKVTIAPVEEETQEEETQVSAEDLEIVDPDVKKVMDLIDMKFKPISDLGERLTALEGVAQAFQHQEASAQISKVAEQYTDFDKYRKTMAKISEELPGLGVEELYILAKHRASDLPIPQPSTHSERPSAIPRTQPASGKKAEPLRGRKGFQQIMKSALERVDFTTQ